MKRFQFKILSLPQNNAIVISPLKKNPATADRKPPVSPDELLETALKNNRPYYSQLEGALTMIKSPDPGNTATVAEALHRITGAYLREGNAVFESPPFAEKTIPSRLTYEKALDYFLSALYFDPLRSGTWLDCGAIFQRLVGYYLAENKSSDYNDEKIMTAHLSSFYCFDQALASAKTTEARSDIWQKAAEMMIRWGHFSEGLDCYHEYASGNRMPLAEYTKIKELFKKSVMIYQRTCQYALYTILKDEIKRYYHQNLSPLLNKTEKSHLPDEKQKRLREIFRDALIEAKEFDLVCKRQDVDGQFIVSTHVMPRIDFHGFSRIAACEFLKWYIRNNPGVSLIHLITGAGHGNPDGLSKLKPALKTFITKNLPEWQSYEFDINPGVLLLAKQDIAAQRHDIKPLLPENELLFFETAKPATYPAAKDPTTPEQTETEADITDRNNTVPPCPEQGNPGIAEPGEDISRNNREVIRQILAVLFIILAAVIVQNVRTNKDN